MKHLRRLAPDWRTLLSAVLIVFSFPPWNLSWLIWIALVPWFWALKRCQSPTRAALQGLWLGIFMSWGGFYWVASVLGEFAGLPLPLSVLGLLLFSLIGQPQFVLLGALIRRFQGRGALGSALALALFYAGVDWLLPKLFVDTLGHALYQRSWLRQAADLGGAPLLTFLIFFSNDALWRFWDRMRSRREPSTWPALRKCAPQIACVFCLWVACLLYGRWRAHQLDRLISRSDQKAQLGVVQANIGDFDKLAARQGVRGAGVKVMETFFQMSDQALALSPKPDAILWPETSYPSTFRTPQTSYEFERDRQMESFAKTRGVPLLFGGYDTENRRDYNALFLLSAQGELSVYRKNILLMFGEYIPFADYFPWIKQAFPQVGYFGRGVGPSVHEVRLEGKAPLKLSPIICYEALFPEYVRQGVLKGGEVILNITNDSWFGPYGEPYLHLALSAFRSIETRRPQVRSTNTGISALILPSGEITQASGVYTQEILNLSVPLTPPVWTLMLAWGDWFCKAAFLTGALALGLIWRREEAPSGSSRP